MSDYIDEIRIKVSSGDGGDGATSFRREKFVQYGGPDGGNGGNGGNIYFLGNNNLSSFKDISQKRYFKARKGGNGKGSKKNGKNGEDIIIEVPLGTEIINLETKELICEVLNHNEMHLIAEGGKGGLGNAIFKSSRNQAPRKSTPGKNGISFNLYLNLKSLSDIGLLGFPNVGKSSLINILTNSKAEIGNYAFTTLSPNLGVIKTFEKDFLIADIPGIIEGASKGKGLGLKFLKHIERSNSLIEVLDSSCSSFDALINQHENLISEIKSYSFDLEKKIKFLIINKYDLCKFKDDIDESKFGGINPIYFSCADCTEEEINSLIKNLSI